MWSYKIIINLKVISRAQDHLASEKKGFILLNWMICFCLQNRVQSRDFYLSRLLLKLSCVGHLYSKNLENLSIRVTKAIDRYLFWSINYTNKFIHKQRNTNFKKQHIKMFLLCLLVNVGLSYKQYEKKILILGTLF